MNLYRQSIALFGIALPVGVAVVLVGAAYYAHSTLEASAASKVTGLASFKSLKTQTSQLSSQSKVHKQNLEHWAELMKQESVIALPSYFREIAAKLPSKEFQQTSFNLGETKTGFGLASAQNSSLLSLSLRGTFRTMQRAFLELETKMPQLQLQDLKITPPAATAAGQSGNLTFQVTYTSWEGLTPSPNSIVSAAAPPESAPANLIKLPSRSIKTEWVNDYVQSVSTALAVAPKDSIDPFGLPQDIAEAILASSDDFGSIKPTKKVKLEEMVKLIQITTIMPGTKSFLIDTREVKVGDTLPLSYSGSTYKVQVTEVTSSKISFRNAETGETTTREMDIMPAGMTAGSGGLEFPGLVTNQADAPIQLAAPEETPNQ